MQRCATWILAVALAGAGGLALAEEHHHPMAGMAAQGAYPLSQGQVRNIDTKTGLLTLKHGPLENLQMPGMTMGFRVKDRSMLERVKVGDSVRFRAENVDGALTVTEIHAAR